MIRVIVLNNTFNNISVLLVEETGVPGENQSCRMSLTKLITKCCIEYTSPGARFKITTLVVTGTDYIGRCKTNYHTITTTMAPIKLLID